jgi:hypothetical protein
MDYSKVNDELRFIRVYKCKYLGWMHRSIHQSHVGDDPFSDVYSGLKDLELTLHRLTRTTICSAKYN